MRREVRAARQSGIGETIVEIQERRNGRRRHRAQPYVVERGINQSPQETRPTTDNPATTGPRT